MSKNKPIVLSFFDDATNTWSYLVGDPATNKAAIVDPVLDFDYNAARTSLESAKQLFDAAKEQGWAVEWILETHAHADHLSAAHWLREQTGAQLAIGKGIIDVQRTFQAIYNIVLPERPFDRLLEEGDRFTIGDLEVQVIATPGHTRDSLTFVVGDAAFVGDTLFMPDYGSARCDFPGGDAGMLFDSVKKLHALPDDTRLYLCHDYPPRGRQPAAMVTVAESRRNNVHLRDGIDREDFIRMRNARDATLAMPRLILPSIQVNIRGGQLPQPDDNGTMYLKIPLNAVGGH